MTLSAKNKNKLKEFINNQVVDVTELDSYVNNGHPDQNFSRFHEPDDEDWDTDEEQEKKGEMAIEKIQGDGLWEWTGIDDRFKDEAIAYIREETGC